MRNIRPIMAALSLFCAAFSSHILQGQDSRQSIPIGEFNFSIPADFHLEKVAAEPLVRWPIVVDWDSNGDLLVVESGGASKPIIEHNKQLLHRLVRLKDGDGDGVLDTRQVVADQLPFTEGVLSLGKRILACAPPHILQLDDEDGDGICEKRSVWFDGQTITGCANDLHGPYLGRDGWVYWCKGAFAEQTHALVGGGTLTTKAAHIFRRRPEGGPIEPVMTGGMDNPVEVATTPEGERFFTSTFLQHPGGGLRDGVAHAVYGGVHGKEQAALAGHLRTGSLMPITAHLGPAAPSGLICLRSPELVVPRAGQRTLVAALFNLQKVVALHLQPQDATYQPALEDLVVADRVDFHPTDILEDCDGSLLIVDTGGWYDLCCPTSRIDQKTAAGAIYRLTNTASVGSTHPNRNRVPTADSELAETIHDARPWIARSAILATREKGVSQQDTDDLTRQVMDSSRPLDNRLDSLWALCALGTDQAMKGVHQALATDEAALIRAACHAISVQRYVMAKPDVERLLEHPDAAVRRVAAEALGRIGDPHSAQRLFAALAQPSPGRHLQHSLFFALMELKAIPEARSLLARSSTALQRRAALVVLDQLGAIDDLDPVVILDSLRSEDAELAAVSSELLGKHPEWAERYRDALLELERQAARNPEAARQLKTIFSGWRSTAAVKDLMQQWLNGVALQSQDVQQLRAELFAVYRGSAIDETWQPVVAKWLSTSPDEVRQSLVSTIAELQLTGTSPIATQLMQLAQQAKDPLVQMEYLAALPVGTAIQEKPVEEGVLNGLAEVDTAAAAVALRALKRVKLSREGGQQLVASLNSQPARNLPIAVEAISRLDSDELDSAMLKSLVGIPAARTLSSDQMVNLYRRRSSSLRTQVERTVAELTRATDDVQAQVERVLAELKPGDPVRGLQLFRSNKTACSACHRMGYVGGEIGPELTRIGGSRTRQALLEAVLFPSARLEQSYQPQKILTTDGQVYNALVRQVESGHWQLQLSADKVIHIAPNQIELSEPSDVSIMPAGIGQLLSIDELSDLMALLESAR